MVRVCNIASLGVLPSARLHTHKSKTHQAVCYFGPATRATHKQLICPPHANPADSAVPPSVFHEITSGKALAYFYPLSSRQHSAYTRHVVVRWKARRNTVIVTDDSGKTGVKCN